MALPQTEKVKLLKAHSIGPKMVEWIESAGITSLNELRHRSAEDLAFQIEVETGQRMNKLAVAALENLVELARSSEDQE